MSYIYLVSYGGWIMEKELMSRIIFILITLSVCFNSPLEAKHKKHAVKKVHHAALAVMGRPHYATLVMEYPSRKILSSENATTLNQPASLTKVMTLYLVFQALDRGTLKLYQPLPISAHAASRQPSKLGLRAGDTITVEEAICGLVTKSANDAASVLGEALGGTEDAFAFKMTDQARKLGLYNTTFKNASGIANSEQLTTATDMANLAAAIMHDYPHYYHYFSLRQFTYKNHLFTNHNHLLGKYEGCDGIKTGYTVPSGFNLISSATRNGHRLIAVVLGGSSIKSRDNRSMQLLDEGFQQLQAPQSITSPTKIEPVKPSAIPQPSLTNTKMSSKDETIEMELEPPHKTIIEEEY